jgi:threonine synthase
VSTGAGHRRDAAPPPAVETGLVCAGCGSLAPAHQPFTPRCPNRRPGDDIDHVMARGIDLLRLDPPADPDPNPFVRYRALFHAYHVARAAGWGDARYVDLVRELDDAVAGVDGTGFHVTPLVRAPAIARAAGLGTRGTVWVKDETGNVAGSHKARHLFGILLELRVAEALGGGDPTSPLAIASCGNAALAAAVVARAARRELRVFVPTSADAAVVDRLGELGAVVVTCPRRPGEAGDPSYLQLQEALTAGAVPFTCQGPDNGLAIEGGSTLAWEITDELRAAGASLDRIVVQVGGGALASGIALGFDDAAAIGAIETVPILDTVQAGGGAPLARAYERVLADLGLVAGTPADPSVVHDGLRRVADHRSRYMWPWESEPVSVAHGILDDETYDWLAVVRAMLITGGRAVVVDEPALVAANLLACGATGIAADETGTAGAAGLLALAAQGILKPDESIAVVLSGVRHPAAPPPPREESR